MHSPVAANIHLCTKYGKMHFFFQLQFKDHLHTNKIKKTLQKPTPPPWEQINLVDIHRQAGKVEKYWQMD